MNTRYPLLKTLSLPALFAALVLTSTTATAATTIAGGNILNQTWTMAGSPYIIEGDIIVPAGSTLTIEAGVEVQVASTDGMAGGFDTARVEVTIHGTLTVNGTAGAPVIFGPQTSSSPGAWYGIVVVDDPSVSVLIRHAQILYPYFGIRTDSQATATVVEDTTIRGASASGLYVTRGIPSFTRSVFESGSSYGARLVSSGSATFSHCIFRNNSGYGLYCNQSSTTTDPVVDNCTFHNNSYGIYLNISGSSPPGLVVTNSIVTGSNNYGIYNYDAPHVNVSYSNIWGNSIATTGVTMGAGNISANPLYVNETDNMRLTSNSPSRFSGDSGQDMGALPYVDDPTPGLYGTLWVNTTLALSGSPYAVGGDLTVGSGATLVVEEGVTMRFASTDIMGSGADTSRSELRVEGTIDVQGTSTNPVVLEPATGTSPGAWYGVVFLEGSTSSSFTGATIRYPVNGIRLLCASGEASISYCTVVQASSTGLLVEAGSHSVDALSLLNGNSYGVRMISSGALHLTNSVVHANSGYGVYLNNSTPSTPSSSLTNCTINANSYGVYANISGTNPPGIAITNSIITNSANFGVYNYDAPAVNVSYSNIWGNSIATTGATMGAGNTAYNPMYVGADDLHLSYGSTMVDAANTAVAPDHDRDGATRPLDGDGIGSAEADMGAYEFVLTPVCGDGLLQTGETCDDGLDNGTYNHCNDTCTGPGPRCGDGTTDAGEEECDDGNASNEDACLNSCVAATCGDGFVRTGVEECDDANSDNTDGCIDTCAGATCGDGYVRAGVEECDDGNSDNTDGCTDSCMISTCGDGIQQAGEACDDGNNSNNDACLNSCELATCGDGFVRTGVEECDDGNGDNNDACLDTCVAASCGDGYVQTGVEACDDGNDDDTDGCTVACALTSCGDGVQQAGEACDDGNSSNSDACLNNCILASCGDGYVQSGVEECDDANGVDSDACRNNCELATCGDGVVQAGVEECDDGNTDDTDGCTAACVAATCGDGLLWEGVEECDDGNDNNEDSCKNDCTLPSCGDGIIQNEEECDDANLNNTDGCVAGCLLAVCGDGYVQAGVEECDDGNTENGDGCDATCHVGNGTPDDTGSGSDSGCGCSTPAKRLPPATPWVVMLLGALVLVRRIKL